MHDQAADSNLDGFVRAMAAASKSLRLYPPASPIPRESLETAARALEAAFADHTAISLEIARSGFASRGVPVASSVTGAADLAQQLRSHGVESITVKQGTSADDLMTVLLAVSREPEDVDGCGGLAMALHEGGVTTVDISCIHLTVAETGVSPADEDLADFLRNLAADPDQLSAWIASASSGDPLAFEEGLAELAKAAGEGGSETLAASLATAFELQETEGKDALLGVAMQEGETRELAADMLIHLQPDTIASSLTQGAFGENVLALSRALTDLPLAERIDAIRQRVQEMLPEAGKTPKESEFLDHMLEVRGKTEPETPLMDADRTYEAVVAAMNVPEKAIHEARTRIDESRQEAPRTAVQMMLSLLDRQDDYEQYCASLDNLAALVPGLIASRDLTTAAHVVEELSRLSARTSHPWVGLDDRLAAALANATGPDTASGLIAAIAQQPDAAAHAHRIVEGGGDSAATALVAAAVRNCPDGLSAAEKILGRRMADLLPTVAEHASPACITPVVERLVRDATPRALKALEDLLRRPDEQSRKATVDALADSGATRAPGVMRAALADASSAVSTAAARGLAKVGGPDAASAIASHMATLDIDGADFALARELIGALARIEDPAAGLELSRLARRKSLIKRRHFNEVQELVRQALDLRRDRG